jgi:hypothetical protein
MPNEQQTRYKTWGQTVVEVASAFVIAATILFRMGVMDERFEETQRAALIATAKADANTVILNRHETEIAVLKSKIISRTSAGSANFGGASTGDDEAPAQAPDYQRAYVDTRYFAYLYGDELDSAYLDNRNGFKRKKN